MCGNNLAHDLFESCDNSIVTVALLQKQSVVSSKCSELQGEIKVDRKTQYVITFLLDCAESINALSAAVVTSFSR